MIVILTILLIIILLYRTKLKFENKTNWAIFLQTHKPVDIEGWLKHHKKLKPEKFYIVVENDPELKIPNKYKDIINVEYVTENSKGTWGSDLDDRLSHNFNRMADKARSEGIEWMMKVDDDELLYSANDENISNLLASIPAEQNSIRVQNYEAYFPEVNKKKGECFVKNAKFLDCSTSKCTAYANGKSFGRISNPNIKQSGSHFMSGPGTSMKFFPIDDLSILHFESCNYLKWKDKFAKMSKNKEGDKQLVYSDFRGSLDDFFKQRFPHYSKSLHAFDNNKNNEKEAIKIYSDMKVINDKQKYKSFKFKEGFQSERLDVIMNYT